MTTSSSINGDRLTIVRPAAETPTTSFAESVRRGLQHQPKYLECQYLYDADGSQLFEQICEQPEYYPTRTEDAILNQHAGNMVDGWDQAPVMIELGSGSSTKTRRLIAAALERYGSLHYVPIEISPTILEESAEDLIRQFSGLRITGIAADYYVALREIDGWFSEPRLIVFLGSSIGNFDRAEAVRMLSTLSKATGPDGRLLLGTDLVKDPSILEAAYDDANKVTARFIFNILTRMNRELDADFDPKQFAYKAWFNPEQARVEMHLISRTDQSVAIPGADVSVDLAEGESIHVENSHKHTDAILNHLAEQSGFVEETHWNDPDHYFQVQRWAPIDQ